MFAITFKEKKFIKYMLKFKMSLHTQNALHNHMNKKHDIIR